MAYLTIRELEYIIESFIVIMFDQVPTQTVCLRKDIKKAVTESVTA